MQEQNYWSRSRDSRISRRRLIAALGGGAGAGLAAAWLAACGGGKQAEVSKEQEGAAAVAAGGGAAARTAELLPPGLEKVYPLIAKYHWSKLTFSQNKPKYGGRLKTRLQFDTPSWDPFDAATAGVQNVPMTFFYNRLTRPDLTMESAFAGKNNLFELRVIGDLAQSWEQPDKDTYIFKLYDNARFHEIPPVNGRHLTAEDFQYTYRAYVAEKSVAQASIFRDVDRFEAVDRLTFKMTTRKPVAYLINSLSSPLPFVIAREAREGRPDGLKNDPPIGTGPFIMKEHKYRNTLRMDRNPNYFRQGLPYLDGIDLIWNDDPAAIVAAYRTNQYHTIFLLGGADTFNDILKTEGWSREGGKTDAHVNQMNSGGNTAYQFRVDQKPFNDVRVRRALAMACDRDKYITAIYGGMGRYALGFPTDWVHPPGKPWPHTKEDFPEWYRYNPDRAKALLAEAGYGPGDLKIELLISSPGSDLDVLVTEDWKKIGVDVKRTVLDRVAYQGSFYGRKYDPGQVFAGASISAGVDLDDFTYRILRTGEVANYYYLSDPELDRLLDAQQAEFDREKRKEIGRAIANRDLDQVYRVWMVTALLWEVKRPFLQNWITHDVYMFANVWGSDQTERTWLDL
jgi:peptide/nickel transport system substrate-binding protein